MYYLISISAKNSGAVINASLFSYLSLIVSFCHFSIVTGLHDSYKCGVKGVS
jgi:hypothetical protein